MPAGAGRIRKLLGHLTDEVAGVRATAADSVTDWTRSFDAPEGAVVSRVLVWLALTETDRAALEAQLHALAELAEWGLVSPDVIRDAGQLSRAGLDGSSAGHFSYLVTLRASGSQHPPDAAAP